MKYLFMFLALTVASPAFAVPSIVVSCEKTPRDKPVKRFEDLVVNLGETKVLNDEVYHDIEVSFLKIDRKRASIDITLYTEKDLGDSQTVKVEISRDSVIGLPLEFDNLHSGSCYVWSEPTPI